MRKGSLEEPSVHAWTLRFTSELRLFLCEGMQICSMNECQVSWLLLSTSTQVIWSNLLQRQLSTERSVQFTNLEVSSQIFHLKASNQTTRSGSLFHTRHYKCLSVILCFHADKKAIRCDSLSIRCFSRHVVLLALRYSLLSRLIFS